MKFPLDVESAVKNAGKTTVSQKLVLIITVTVLVSVFVATKITVILRGIGIPVFLGLLTQAVITIIIIVTLFRHFVLRENDKVKEYENSKEVSLSNYYYLEDKENLEEIGTAPIFEFSDGNFMVAIRFSYGNFTRKSADCTRELFQSIIKKVYMEGFELRTVNMPEKFEDTYECRTFLSGLSRIEQDSVSDVMRSVATGILKECSNYNSLMDTTFLVKTIDPVQIENYKDLIEIIFKEYSTREHSIRRLSFLGRDDIKRFMRDYYGLEALDLSSLKTAKVDVGLLSEFRTLVKVCEMELSTGEIKVVNSSKVSNKSKRVF